MAASFSDLPPEIGYQQLEDLPVEEAYNIVRKNRTLAERYPEFLQDVEQLMKLAKEAKEIPGSLSGKYDIFHENEYDIYRQQYIQDYLDKTPSHIVAKLLTYLLELCADKMEMGWPHTYLDEEGEEVTETVPFEVLKDRSHHFAMQNFWKGLTIKELRELLPKPTRGRPRIPRIRQPSTNSNTNNIQQTSTQQPPTPQQFQTYIQQLQALPPAFIQQYIPPTVYPQQIPTPQRTLPPPQRTLPPPTRTQPPQRTLPPPPPTAYPPPQRTQPAPTRTQPAPTRGAGAVSRPPAPVRRTSY